MEEEKNNNSVLGKTGDKLKKGAKEQAKQARKKIIKKILQILAPILLKLLLLLVIALIILNLINAVMKLFDSSESKEIVGGALEYSYISYSGSQETEQEINGYKILPTINTEKGGYELKFVFKDENNNEISEDNVIADIKDKLDSNNIDHSQLDNNVTDLEILAVLEKNGLDLKDYTQEELNCIPMFIKAQIATQSFDIRENKTPINVEDMLNGDVIYGTIDVRKTKVGSDSKENYQRLTYMEYEEFKALEQTNSQDSIDTAKQHFSIDEEGKLLLAKWNTRNVSVSYLDKDGKSLSDDEIAKIPEENKVDGEDKYSISLLEVEYQKNISKYALNFGVLSDLLLVTKNPAFCADLCETAFNSKIVIDFREETSITDSQEDTTYNHVTLNCDYARYEVTGTETSSNETSSHVRSGQGDPNNSEELKNDYGFYRNVPSTTDQRGTVTYTWSYNSNRYKLKWYKEISDPVLWELYRIDEEPVTQDLPTQGNLNDANPELIIGGGPEEGFENENYTNRDEWIYTVHVDSHIVNNYYKYEIAEVDCWFTKYKKEYADPTIENRSAASNPPTVEGEFEQTSDTQVITEEIEIEQKINDNEVIKSYVEQKESNYKQTYQNAENVKCTIRELKEEIWEKENSTYVSSSTTKRDKFGEEDADTTNITLKNVAYIDNKLEYDDKDGTEVGFLSIYNKYITNGEDLYLQQDAEKLLFEMLEDDASTKVYSDLIKYLLYAYDQIDRGVTDFSELLDIFKVKDFKKTHIMGSALVEVYKSFEYNDLRMLRNGTMSYEEFKAHGYRSDTVEIIDNKMKYKMYHLDVDTANTSDHSWNFSYGLLIHSDKYGQVLDTYLLEKVGLSYGELMANPGVDFWDADTIDQLCLYVIQDRKDKINNYYKDKRIELDSNELDAFVMIALGFGNCYAKDDNSLNLLRNYKDKSITQEQFMNGFQIQNSSGSRPFIYGDWEKSGRAETIRQMFFNNKYILSTGEEIDSFGDGILGYAKMIHDYMSDTDHLYYYCLNGTEKSIQEHRNAGIHNCGLAPNFEQSKQEGQHGYRLTCCATYVSWVLEEAGLIETHCNGCGALDNELSSWEKINDYSELEPGDIVFMDTNGVNNGSLEHVQIYVGDGCWYNAGSNSAIHTVEPYNADASSQFVYARRQP